MTNRRTFLRGFASAALAAGALSRGAAAALPPGGWEPGVKAALDALIAKYRGDPNAYAVFDFDNTTTFGDISNTCMWRLLETLAFKVDPEVALTSGIPSFYKPEAKAIAALVPRAREVPEDRRGFSPIWSELVRRYWALYRRLIDECGTDIAYPWIAYIFAGYTSAEWQDFAKAAIKRDLARGGIWIDPRVPGERRGLSFAPEMKALYAALREAGIATYIVSASNRELVLAASGPDFGFDVPPERAFGYVHLKDADGRYLPAFDPAHIQTQAKGKTTFIKYAIAPRHGGQGPILAAGDSMGDYAMLTDFAPRETALVFDRAQKGTPLADLMARAASSGGKILVQGRDEPNGRFVPSCRSIIAR